MYKSGDYCKDSFIPLLLSYSYDRGEFVFISNNLLYFSLKMFGTNHYFSYICPKHIIYY